MTENIPPGIRFKRILEHFNLSQQAAAELFKFSKGYISQMVNNHSEIPSKILLELKARFPAVNINWLLTGEGEMLVPEKPQLLLVAESDQEYRNDPLNTFRREWENMRSRLQYLETEMKIMESRIQELEERLNNQ